MSRFVDRAEIHVAAGNGGHGCASIRREKFKPLGGPDGGNGGHGGDVVLVVDPGVHTLLDFHYRSHARAASGKQGHGSHRAGAAGHALRLPVPEGTVVLGADGAVLADLTGAGTSYVAARGGRGGLGNAALASKARKAPGFALLGEHGEAHDLVLEVRSVADVGLIGFPSAGKSSLIAVLSAARPAIADYPFTTLAPNLGVVTAGETGDSAARGAARGTGTVFTVADVPGLIPGAATGKGLGLDFLRHVERCAVLVHVIDCATFEPGRDPVSDIDAIEAELAQYTAVLGPELDSRPRIVVLNKLDVPDAAELAEIVRPDVVARSYQVHEVSTATGQGLRELSFALAELVEQHRATQPPDEPPRVRLRPEPLAEQGFTVARDPQDPEAFVVHGARPERWVEQTDFNNDEAVRFLADRLDRLGVETELAGKGARAGDTVTIGGVSFEWEPASPAERADAAAARGGTGAPAPAPPEPGSRVTARQRKEARRRRRTGDELPEAAAGDATAGEPRPPGEAVRRSDGAS